MAGERRTRLQQRIGAARGTAAVCAVLTLLFTFITVVALGNPGILFIVLLTVSALGTVAALMRVRQLQEQLKDLPPFER